MTDHPETPSRERPPWRRVRLQQLGAAGTAMRALPRNPAFLIGAAVLGVVGMLAWRNREKIASKAAGH